MVESCTEREPYPESADEYFGVSRDVRAPELRQCGFRAVHAAGHQRLAAGADDQLSILPRQRDQRAVWRAGFVEDLERLHIASIRSRHVIMAACAYESFSRL